MSPHASDTSRSDATESGKTASENRSPDSNGASTPVQPQPRPLTFARPNHVASDEQVSESPAGTLSDDEPRSFNRDLSWLEFNRRVLAQAADERIPLLERVKFLAIFTSNLDEFFMKRVGLVKRQIRAGVDSPWSSGFTPRQLIGAIRELVAELQVEQARIERDLIRPALARHDIHLVAYQDLSPREQRQVDDHFQTSVFPALTPLAVDPGHRFPFISNLSDNLALLASAPTGGTPNDPEPAPPTYFARVKIPHTLRRFVALPPKPGRKPEKFVPLPDVIRHNLDHLFPDTVIHEQVHFRVTRSAGIQRDELEAATLLESVEADLKQRKFARAVRLEIERDPSPTILRTLMDRLNLDAQDVYERPGPIDYLALYEIADIDRPDLKDKRWRAEPPPRLRLAGGANAAKPAAFFAAVRKQDILVHHPYESFADSVERLIALAAVDPDVVTIKQTLYRTSPDSPFIESMIRAAESGKQVACLVELRARFDEDRNVTFARKLEKAGVHVAYGVVGYKTHCKTALVVRKERGALRCYAHIGTGNYHPKTAHLYTDVGLFTCDPVITADLVSLFNYLTGLSATQSYSQLLVAPFNMRRRFCELIDREIAFAKRGLPARIIAKLNSLEDAEIVEKLYQASQGGVQVRLIVRGFCCLRPGVPGLSDNIAVVSVVGRFLEHSRIFHFAAGQEDPADGDWFLGSADWMYRNLNTRVECATPVKDQDARRRLMRILEVSLADHRHAWDLRPDGSYVRRTPDRNADPDSPHAMGTFAALMADATR
jgi:polyphosphate kinase